MGLLLGIGVRLGLGSGLRREVLFCYFGLGEALVLTLIYEYAPLCQSYQNMPNTPP